MIDEFKPATMLHKQSRCVAQYSALRQFQNVQNVSILSI